MNIAIICPTMDETDAIRKVFPGPWTDASTKARYLYSWSTLQVNDKTIRIAVFTLSGTTSGITGFLDQCPDALVIIAGSCVGNPATTEFGDLVVAEKVLPSAVNKIQWSLELNLCNAIHYINSTTFDPKVSRPISLESVQKSMLSALLKVGEDRITPGEWKQLCPDISEKFSTYLKTLREGNYISCNPTNYHVSLTEKGHQLLKTDQKDASNQPRIHTGSMLSSYDADPSHWQQSDKLYGIAELSPIYMWIKQPTVIVTAVTSINDTSADSDWKLYSHQVLASWVLKFVNSYSSL